MTTCQPNNSEMTFFDRENALLLREYRDLYKHVTFLKLNSEVNEQLEIGELPKKSHDEFSAYGSPFVTYNDHVPASDDFDILKDMDEDMRRAIELSKLEQ